MRAVIWVLPCSLYVPPLLVLHMGTASVRLSMAGHSVRSCSILPTNVLIVVREDFGKVKVSIVSLRIGEFVGPDGPPALSAGFQ